MPEQVDSYRFVSSFTRRVMQAWVKREPSRPIPWTPLPKPLTHCTVAILSSAGLALRDDVPFDQEGERQNPWWGDPSFRVLPRDATADGVRLYHLHLNPSFAEADLNCIMPLQRLLEVEARGEIGRSAERHYSIMGYILQPEVLLAETTPTIIAGLQEEHVDVVLLVPV